MEIVSDYLAELFEDQESRELPEFAGMGDFIQAGKATDERAVMTYVGGVLESSESVAPQIARLRALYSAAMAEGDGYYREAFAVRKREVPDLIRIFGVGDLGRLRKELRNAERGLAKKIKEYYESVGSDGFVDIKVRVSVRDDFSAFLRRANDVANRRMIRVNGLVDQINALQSKVDALRERIALGERLCGVLAQLDSGIAELGPVREQVAQEVEEVVPLEDEIPVDSGDSSSTIPSRPKRKRRIADNTSKEAGNRRPEQVDSFQVDFGKLRQVIAIAQENGTAIRVLTGGGSRIVASFLPKWTDLLKQLGFDGEVRAVNYHQMGNSPRSPVIVPKKMNTHKNLWADVVAIYVVIDAQPNLLINRSNSSS